MQKLTHPLEKLVETITYKGVEFEVVERPDVLWVGCARYASNNTDEPNMDGVLKRYQKLCKKAPYREKVNPDYSACLNINFSTSEKPCGMMYACEFYPDQQHEKFDLFTQPGGLWLRVRNDEKAAALCGYNETERLLTRGITRTCTLQEKMLRCQAQRTNTVICKIPMCIYRLNIIAMRNTARRRIRITHIYR